MPLNLSNLRGRLFFNIRAEGYAEPPAIHLPNGKVLVLQRDGDAWQAQIEEQIQGCLLYTSTQSPQVILMGRQQGDDPLQDALSARTLRDLQIAVQLPDGNWLVVREKAPADMVSRYALYLSGLVGRILLIILFSYAMAWMILRLSLIHI